MLVKLISMNHPILVTKHWPHGDLPKEPVLALWSAIGNVGKNVAEQIIRDLYNQPQYVEIPIKNLSADKLVEFAKHFDFSIEDVAEKEPAKPGTLKLYTVTVNLRFTARKPVKQYTALVLSSTAKVAEAEVMKALNFDPDEHTGNVYVDEVKGPFSNGQVLTLNSHT